MFLLDQSRRDSAIATTRSVVAVAALVTLAGAFNAAASELELSTRRDGEGVAIIARARLTVSIEAAWQVLTDYERYPAFLPDMASSKVMSREANRLVVEQRGEMRFLWIRMPLLVTMKVVETSPTRVESTLISGTLRELRGRYDLVRDASGLQFVYSARVVPADEHSSLFDHVAIRANVSRQLEALVREIERAGQKRE